MYTSSDGKIIDLLRREATKDTANRYVTWLIDILFKPEEIVAILPQNLPEDPKYQMLKGNSQWIGLSHLHRSCNFSDAVRNKFRLHSDELDTIWSWLHIVTLAKRRTLVGKMKNRKENNRSDD
jgi:hypothetical protein